MWSRRRRRLEEELRLAKAALAVANEQLAASFTARPADLGSVSSEDLLAELGKRVAS